MKAIDPAVVEEYYTNNSGRYFKIGTSGVTVKYNTQYHTIVCMTCRTTDSCIHTEAAWRRLKDLKDDAVNDAYEAVLGE